MVSVKNLFHSLIHHIFRKKIVVFLTGVLKPKQLRWIYESFGHSQPKWFFESFGDKKVAPWLSVHKSMSGYKTTKLLNRRRKNILAQSLNKFGSHPSWTVSNVLAFSKRNSLDHLDQHGSSSLNTKEHQTYFL